jgi:hypothetical protein
MKGDLDASLAQVATVLDIPPELRLSTVTGYMVNLDRRLRHRRFQQSKVASELRKTIQEFNSTALLNTPIERNL